jgi:small conductance mechanosensitive channel
MELDQQTLDILGGLISRAMEFGVGWIIVGWIQRRVIALLQRSQVEPTLQPIIASVVRYTLMIFILVAVLAQFGVQTASIIVKSAITSTQRGAPAQLARSASS